MGEQITEGKHFMEIIDKINKEGVSIIIGARNEYPQVAMTIGNLMEDMHNSGIDKWEIILMDNGSLDDTSIFFEWKHTRAPTFKKYLGYVPATARSGRKSYIHSPRGLVHEGYLRIFYDPVYSNVGTRNKGVLKARYKNVIFSDAHIIVRPGTIRSVVSTLIKNKGIVHAPIGWMGASCYNHQAGYQYSYKVGEKIWGTWNKSRISEDKAFYIPLCGHAFLAVRRDEFLETRGYPYAQRVYGGGEPYLDTKYWMLGKTSMMDPNALVYHLSAGRGYNWHNGDLIHNMFLVSEILGGEEWSDRILITYLNKRGADNDYIRSLHAEALEEAKEDKRWLNKHKKHTFEEVLGLHHERAVKEMSEEEIENLDEDWWCTQCTKRGNPDPHVMRVWDRLNQEKIGYHRSWVVEFALTRNDAGEVFIGNTKITHPDALTVADKYV